MPSSSKALVILSPTRAILAHHSNEIHRKLLYLAHCIGWNDCVVGARTGWLAMLECIACTEFMLPLPLLLRGENFLLLYWTVWEMCMALRDFHDDHGCVGNPLLTPDNVVSLSHTSSAIPTTCAWRDQEEKRTLERVTVWEINVYLFLYLSIKYLILCIWN